MALRGVLLVGTIVLGSISLPRVALAACPNSCELAVGQPILDPPLPCAGEQARPETCDCGVSLQVGNGCQQPIEAVDFRFDTCWSSSQDSNDFEHNCSVVQPDKIGTVKARLGDIGARELTFRLRSNGVEHTLKVTSSVTSLGKDAGTCSIRPLCTRHRLPVAHCLLVAGFAGFTVARGAARRRRSSSVH